MKVEGIATICLYNIVHVAIIIIIIVLVQSEPVRPTNGVDQTSSSHRAPHASATLPPHAAPPSGDKVQRTGSFDRHSASTDKHDKDGKKRHSVFGGLFKKDKDKKDKKKDKH